MKRSILLLVLLTSQIAMADSPRVEPGPVMKMENGAIEMARLLMDPQLSGCVKQFQKSNVLVQSVTVQNLAPGATQYKIQGAILVGGDVVIGQRTMTILEKENRQFSTRSFLRTCRVLDVRDMSSSDDDLDSGS